jgi:hypothetical protein
MPSKVGNIALNKFGKFSLEKKKTFEIECIPLNYYLIDK